MGLSRYGAGALLQASTGVSAVPWGAPLYLALLTGAASGAQLPEATYAGYARVVVPAAAWAPWDGVALVNDDPIALAPVLSGPGVLIVQAALCTAAVAGEVVHLLDVVPFWLAVADAAPQIAAGMLVLEL